MRAVVVLALAAILCSVASATVTAPTTQEQAKALKDHWPACSQIVHGRLGSLTPADQPTMPYYFSATAAQVNATGYFTYSPCTTKKMSEPPLHGAGNLFVKVVDTLGNGRNSFYAVYAAADLARTAVFHMPEQKNDVAKFTATLQQTSDSSASAPMTAIVTTSCAETDVVASPNATFSVQNNVLNVYFTDINACQRFPYTNEAMPPGAIAALIICIAFFVIQFSICGWYHKTHKETTPFTEQQVE